MFDRRERNAEIFRNTEHMYKTNDRLKSAVYSSVKRQQLIQESDIVEKKTQLGRNGTIIVSGKRTLEASEPYAKQGKKVCVLNYASATNPGGGVVHGSSAQEEAICRCSTLYPCLNSKLMWDGFYSVHRAANNPLYNDDCIYTPDVTVFKSDTDFPVLLADADWWSVDVLTCAAPNLRLVPSNRMNPGAGSRKADISAMELSTLWEKRIKRVFDVAVTGGAEVLILGAFGCGAFRNSPKLVAEVFAKYTKIYRGFFDVIEFAVYHTEREKENFEAFRIAMKGLM